MRKGYTICNDEVLSMDKNIAVMNYFYINEVHNMPTVSDGKNLSLCIGIWKLKTLKK